MLDRQPNATRGTVLVAAGVLCLVPDSTLVRLVDASSLTTAFWRGLLVSVTLFAGLAIRYRLGLGPVLRAMGLAGVASAAFWSVTSLLFVASIDRTAVANTLVIISAAPLFAAGLTRLTLGHEVPRRTWLAIPVAILGVVITVSGSAGTGDLVGDGLALLLAMVVAANLTVLSSRPSIDMLPAAAIGGVLTAAVLGVAGGSLAVSHEDVVPLVLMGAVFVPAALALITAGTRHLASAEVSLLLLLEAALGPLLAWAVIGETVGARTFVGGALLLSTLGLHSAAGIRAGRRRVPPIVATGVR